MKHAHAALAREAPASLAAVANARVRQRLPTHLVIGAGGAKLERELLHQQGRVNVRLRIAKQRENKLRIRASRSALKAKGGR